MSELDPPNASGNAAALRRPVSLLQTHGLAALQAVLLLVPALWALGHLYPPINHDAALILDVSRRWLDGARLYVDVIDVNPPLIFVLSLLPEIVARLLGIIDGPTAFVLSTLCLIALSLAMTHRVVAWSGELFGPIATFVLLPLAAFLLVVHPGDMFGQREHLMLAAAMPYLLAATARGAGLRPPARLLLPVMLLAGIGFALKPHFLLAPALIEAHLLLARRGLGPRDPALWALAFGAMLHVAIMRFVTPAYLEDVVPLALRQYAEQGDAMWDAATGGVIGFAIAAWIPLAGAAAFLPVLRLQRSLVLFVLAGIVAAVVQAKGWPYQSLPANAGCILLASTTLAAIADAVFARLRRPAGGVVLAGLVLLAGCYNGLAVERAFQPQRHFAGSDTKHLLDIVRLYATDGRVLVISPGVQPIFPMANYAGVRLVGRFESMWLLQSLYWDCARRYHYNPPWRMSADEHRVFDDLSAEFARVRPSLVIIDRDAGVPVCGDEAFDYLDYFGRHPDFAATMAAYEEVGGFGRYRLFRRNDEAASPEE